MARQVDFNKKIVIDDVLCPSCRNKVKLLENMKKMNEFKKKV